MEVRELGDGRVVAEASTDAEIHDVMAAIAPEVARELPALLAAVARVAARFGIPREGDSWEALEAAAEAALLAARYDAECAERLTGGAF